MPWIIDHIIDALGVTYIVAMVVGGVYLLEHPWMLFQ